jgi:hypothetical protein
LRQDSSDHHVFDDGPCLSKSFFSGGSDDFGHLTVTEVYDPVFESAY